MITSNAKAMDYLEQAKTWLDQHPGEVVVIWISKHGDDCATGTKQWPGGELMVMSMIMMMMPCMLCQGQSR